ncbi:MAG: tetratricopeptide repeat protein [Streptosporangiales bacterium]|nr:tetratricopeptide repeat protein [Streptosporangiales bacterium]
MVRCTERHGHRGGLVEFGVLGRLEITHQGGSVVVETPRNRGVLAILLARANDLVSVEQLVDELWPQRPPAQARALVRGYVSRVRRALRNTPAADRLVTRKPGYLMRVEDGELDVHRFEKLIADARIARQAGRLGHCVTLFRQAHRLWRGAPFADMPPTSIITASATRLAELRLASLEELYDTVLTNGHDAEIVTDLIDLVAEHPLRERFVAQLMLALHRGGRTADALTAYQQVKQRLADEIGIDPGNQLQQLQLAILRNDRDLAPGQTSPPSPLLRPDDEMAQEVPVPRQLPGDLSTFTGREVELARLLTIAGRNAGNADVPAAPVIVTIDGMPGVGKTALAVHAAHRLADRYADGQLFVDLHGFTREVTPVDPAGALDQMLRGMGVRGEQIPQDLDARAALYRTRLADRRMLVVLDNAIDEAHVSRLLPGTPGCLVLITSRRRLAGLDDAHSLSLDALPLKDGLGLFSRITGEDHTSPTVAEIVELCGRLPLAIRIAAARLSARSCWTAADLADRLRDHQHRLSELDFNPRSVTAAVDLSYRQLSTAHRRMFRLLSLHPGADIDAYAAAALADTTVRDATRLLDDLTDAHLQHEPTPGRFRFHDLLRVYATHASVDKDSEAARRAALSRLFDHYTHTASVATDVVYPHLAAYLPRIRRPASPTPAFAEQTNGRPEGQADRRTGAAAWLEAELINLLAAASYAAGHGWPAHTLHLSATLRRHLHRRGRYTQIVDLVGHALDTARELGHQLGELDALCGLGEVHKFQSRFEPAADCFSQALHIARRIGHRLGEYDALRGLGYLHRYQNRFEPAADCFGQALHIARDIGSDLCELTALCSLGHLHRSQKRLGAAADCFGQALDIARDIGDRESELIALHGLGVTRRAQGRYGSAADCLEQALNFALETDDHNYQFEVLHNLGYTRRATGQPAAAFTHHRVARDLACDLGQPADQARALYGLARVHSDLGRHRQAREHWQLALNILTDLGLQHAEEVSIDQIRAHLDDPRDRR